MTGDLGSHSWGMITAGGSSVCPLAWGKHSDFSTEHLK